MNLLMRKINKLFYTFLELPAKGYRYLRKKAFLNTIKYCGKDVNIAQNFIFDGADNISIGDSSAIGPNAILYATKADLTIGKYVMIGPNVTIVTGEHRTDVIGEYMRNIGNDMKLPENDQPIIIEDDVWIGSNVTILKGAHIGRGAIIHAGCVVSGNIKPYTLYISPKLKVARFTDEEIEEHEKMIEEKYGK